MGENHFESGSIQFSGSAGAPRRSCKTGRTFIGGREWERGSFSRPKSWLVIARLFCFREEQGLARRLLTGAGQVTDWFAIASLRARSVTKPQFCDMGLSITIPFGACCLVFTKGRGIILAKKRVRETSGHLTWQRPRFLSKSPGRVWVPRVPADLVRNPAGYCFRAAPEVNSC